MLERYSAQLPQDARALINNAYRIDELTIVTELIKQAELDNEQLIAIRNKATALVEQVRSERKKAQVLIPF